MPRQIMTEAAPRMYISARSPLSDERRRSFYTILESAKLEWDSVFPVIEVLGEYLNYVESEDKKRFDPSDVAESLRMLTQLTEIDNRLKNETEKSCRNRILGLSVNFDHDIRDAAVKLLQVFRYGKVFDYSSLRRKVRMYGATVIIGAGFSYDSYVPLQQETDLILQNALFADGHENAKDLVRDDPRECWRLIKKKPETFKKTFIEVQRKNQPSFQHEALAMLFHEGTVKNIIDFNWDNLLERAYESKYGKYREKPSKVVTEEDELLVGLTQTGEPTHAIWKPHGGYSENEIKVKNELIDVLEKKTEVYRFRPNIDESLGIKDNANNVMSNLVEGLM